MAHENDEGLQNFVIGLALLLAAVVAYYIGRDAWTRWREARRAALEAGAPNDLGGSPRAGTAPGKRSGATPTSLPPLLLLRKADKRGIDRPVPSVAPPPVPLSPDNRKD